MQKLSTFEVGEVCWAGALARNVMKNWSKCYGRRSRMRVRVREQRLVRAGAMVTLQKRCQRLETSNKHNFFVLTPISELFF